MLKRSDVRRARDVIDDRVKVTPILTCRALDRRVGYKLFMKGEHLQTTGSFKVRGALNYLAQAHGQVAGAGVVTVSAGNHAQAVAWAGTTAGVRSVVIMPASASRAKIEASREYGAEVRLAKDAASAFSEAHRVADAEGLTFMHPFDHPAVVAGQGTVGLELVDQVPDLDAVIVPVGGGGLISGILTALAEARPNLLIFGVEPVGAAAMTASLAAGRAVTLATPPESIADGLAPPMAGELTYEIVRRYAEDVVTVSDDEIREAMELILSRAKAVVEPSAAAPYAALLSERIALPRDARVALILSGGNVALEEIPRFLPKTNA